jgi:predicted ATPase
LTPKALLEQLSERLDTFSSGPADLTHSQRSIRGALDWSYQLLDTSERQPFGRMALFTGGATMEAILAVSGDTSQASTLVSQVVESLADKSLLILGDVGDTTRLGALEVVREYALERLIEYEGALRLEDLYRTHAAHFAALADRAQRALGGPDQVQWLEHLDADHDNFRAAILHSDYQLATTLLDEARELYHTLGDQGGSPLR